MINAEEKNIHSSVDTVASNSEVEVLAAACWAGGAMPTPGWEQARCCSRQAQSVAAR
jgi:hypothetical protein